jgi:hypothetical protein
MLINEIRVIADSLAHDDPVACHLLHVLIDELDLSPSHRLVRAITLALD